MENKKRSPWKWILVGLGILTAAFVLWVLVKYIIILRAHTPEVAYDPNVWFELAPEGAVTGEGKPLSTRMRVGTENKVIVFFYGGGISIDEFTAARPYLGFTVDREPGFYANSIDGYIPDYCELGLGSRQVNNPFRNWSVIVIPYTTADFHIGNSEYVYTDLSGQEKVLYHHGYSNYRAIMDAAAEFTGSAPEELLVAGWSAGGYGAAILTEDLMENYYPEAGHVTVCVDSSLLLLDNWEEVARDVWGAPEEIVEKIRSNNLIVDFLGALYDTYGDEITYLYVGSVRDGALAKYQTYFDTGVYTASNRAAWVFTNYLRKSVRDLQARVPTIGIYLFDRLPFSWIPWLNLLTQHTVLETQTAFWRLTGGRSPIEWVNAAIYGNVYTVGLEKLR